MEGWGEEEDTGAAALVEAGLSATGCSDFEQAARSRKPASTSGIEVFFTDSSKDFGARAARIIPLAQEPKFRDEASVGDVPATGVVPAAGTRSLCDLHPLRQGGEHAAPQAAVTARHENPECPTAS